jgi:hypothetical protein
MNMALGLRNCAVSHIRQLSLSDSGYRCAGLPVCGEATAFDHPLGKIYANGKIYKFLVLNIFLIYTRFIVGAMTALIA